MVTSLRDRLVTYKRPQLEGMDSRATPGFDGDKAAGKAAKRALAPDLAHLQQQLYAEGTTGGRRSVLLILQGMDTSGKGGVIKKVVGLVNPLGVRVATFSAPTEEELAHDFLWRVERHLPDAGHLGVFDRSHYEDVLIGKVRQLADEDEIERRYGAINDFEQAYVDGGGTILKCLLHITPDDQADRLAARLDDPTKHWKFDPSDLDERALWPQYRDAYETMVERCSTDAAPWFVVPSGRKWYRNWAVATLLHETLSSLSPHWPRATFDVRAERARLLASPY